MAHINRRVKPLKHFDGYTHEDLYGVLRVLVGRRFSLGISQKELAARMNVSASVLSRLEKSDIRVERPPTLSQLQTYARALGVEVRLAIIPVDEN